MAVVWKYRQIYIQFTSLRHLNFYKNGLRPTVTKLFIELQRDCDFPYKKTLLRLLLKKMGVCFHILNKRQIILGSCKIV